MHLFDPDPVMVGRAIRDIRRAIGWTQRDLARRAGVSQSTVAALEQGHGSVSIEMAQRVLRAMGARFRLQVDAPFLTDRRDQAEPAHARCVAYVADRLQRAGWLVATEVEVGEPGRRGWIDLLAWHPVSHVLLVIEVKTEIHDTGDIERAVARYERGAWSAARARGWAPRMTVGVLLVLATEVVEGRLRDNRATFDRAFPCRAVDLRELVASGWPPAESAGSRVAASSASLPSAHTGPTRRHLAMIDPLSRRADWLRPPRIDGRRSPAPYRDSTAFARARTERGRGHRRHGGSPVAGGRRRPLPGDAGGLTARSDRPG